MPKRAIHWGRFGLKRQILAGFPSASSKLRDGIAVDGWFRSSKGGMTWRSWRTQPRCIFAHCCATDTPLNTCVLAGATLTGYVDPSTTTVCPAHGTLPTGACNYTMYYTPVSGGTTQNYEICTYLETGSGTLPKGPIYIASSTAGSVLAGCP